MAAESPFGPLPMTVAVQFIAVQLWKRILERIVETCMANVKHIPDGYPAVIPYLVVQDVEALVDFLIRVFDAKEGHRSLRPDGTIMHTEVRIGDSVIMMGGANEQFKPMPCGLYVYVPDTDVAYKRALQAGATSLMEPADQLYGDRNAGVKDPTGNYWWIGTHIDDVSPDEIDKRYAASSGKR